MKKYIILLQLILLSCVVFGQASWKKYNNNPVLTKGTSQYDAIAMGQPTCLYENDTIRMWYAAVGADMKARICYAWSLDGITWEKYNSATPVFDVGQAGEWDDTWMDAPEIVKGPDLYYLYYYGDTAQQGPEISSAYGVATSPDGIDWTRHNDNPILEKGDSADWDGKWIESPAVIYDESDSLFYMYYNGMGWNWLCNIGLATSEDGIHFTKSDQNPIMSYGSGGEFDDMWLGTPAVIRNNGLWQMWYCGFSSSSGFNNLQIGYAMSEDGINWNKFAGNPVYNRFYEPFDSLNDNDGPWAPDVVYIPDQEKYIMLYEGTSGIQLAESFESDYSYIPMIDESKQWNTVIGYYDFTTWVEETFMYRFNGEINLSNKEYHILQRSTDENGLYWSDYSFLREDNKVIYEYVNNGPEQILYDYSLDVGDTVIIRTNLEFTVSYIDTVYFADNLRRVLYLGYEGEQDTSFCEKWYEGVGSNAGFMESGYFGLVGGSNELLCYKEYDSVLYQNSYYNDCYIFTSEDEFNMINNVKLFPNPAKDYFRIENNYNIDLEFLLFDVFGRQVRVNDIERNSVKDIYPNLCPGIYFYYLENNDSVIKSGRLVVL
jgi:hypothetical protein